MSRWRRLGRGAMLLEVILSISIFVMVALAALGLAGHALASMRRAADARFAADLARTVVSRIEIGEIAPEAAGGPAPPLGSSVLADGDRGESPAGWSVRVESRPGPLAELTLVTVHVDHQATPGVDESRTVYTLRQLVRLGGPVAAAGEARP